MCGTILSRESMVYPTDGTTLLLTVGSKWSDHINKETNGSQRFKHASDVAQSRLPSPLCRGPFHSRSFGLHASTYVPLCPLFCSWCSVGQTLPLRSCAGKCFHVAPFRSLWWSWLPHVCCCRPVLCNSYTSLISASTCSRLRESGITPKSNSPTTCSTHLLANTCSM